METEVSRIRLTRLRFPSKIRQQSHKPTRLLRFASPVPRLHPNDKHSDSRHHLICCNFRACVNFRETVFVYQ